MTDDIVTRLTDILGAGAVVTGDAVLRREFPWQTHDSCHAKAIIYPTSTDEVSQILSACNASGQTVVPFGGTTNLVQGCATTADDIVISLQKMNVIEELDRSARTIIAQAGVTMQAAQRATEDAGLLFPVDTGARDNCMLGGMVSTNAGGTKVIRYGMTRDSVLGLEAVLADGTVVSSMNRFIKNNSGFDLKHLFIGSEGVLGIITRVVLQLATQPRSHNVALLACDNFDDVVRALRVARDQLPNTLTGFEVMWNSFYERAVEPRGRLAAPLATGSCCYVLLESMGVNEEQDSGAFEQTLESLMSEELVVDGLIAKSDKERELIWAIRDEVEPFLGIARNFDVSLKSADVGAYLADVEVAMKAAFEGAEVIGFGHLGDNNVHLSVLVDAQTEDATQVIEQIIYARLKSYGGAISAEHGIGLEKRAYLPISRTPAEIDLMIRLKQMMDPNNILNPGKVVDAR
jgi:FAD/FMN-containing dehydrogenase